jgi:O-antigen ligase
MTLTADPPIVRRRLFVDQAGFVALCGAAGALQFSIAAAQVLLTVALVCWAVLLVLERKSIDMPAFAWGLAAYAGVTLVSIAFSPEPVTSLMAGKQMVLFLVVPLVYRFAAGQRASWMVTVILTFAAASAALGIVQFGILRYDNLGQRVQGTLGHYMTYSGLLMLVIGAALARVLFGRSERLWAALVMPALAVAVVLTLTRTAAVGVCAAAVLLLMLKNVRLLAVLPLVAIVFVAVAPSQVNRRFASVVDMSDPTIRDRFAMLRQGGRMVKAHPLVGVGPNMVKEVYAEYRDAHAVNENNPHLHNVPLQIAAERGVPALLVWLAFIAGLIVALVRRARLSDQRYLAAAGLAAVTSMLAAGMFEYNFGDSEFLMLFLILVTLPFAADRQTASA